MADWVSMFVCVFACLVLLSIPSPATGHGKEGAREGVNVVGLKEFGLIVEDLQLVQHLLGEKEGSILNIHKPGVSSHGISIQICAGA